MQSGDKDPQLSYLESMIKDMVSQKHETLCSIAVKGHAAIVMLMAKLDSHFAASSPLSESPLSSLLKASSFRCSSPPAFCLAFSFGVSTASLLFVPLLLSFFPPFSY